MRGHNLYHALLALDKLQNVQRYLREQFDPHMTRFEAKANLEARALVFRAQNAFMRAYGMEITKGEIDAARERGRA